MATSHFQISDGVEPFPVSGAGANQNCVKTLRWFAVFTVPRNELSVVRHLDLRQVESFCPTYESVRIWKNRRRVKIVSPFFRPISLHGFTARSDRRFFVRQAF